MTANHLLFLGMTLFYLAIPDASLREAVTEQLKLTGLGPSPMAGLPNEPPADTSLTIIDEAALDAKTIKRIAALAGSKSFIMLLGKLPENVDENLFAEIFVKPLRLGHLMARLQFFSEVAPRLRSAPMTIGPYRFEAQQRSLTSGEDVIRLTEKESALLEYLAQSLAPVGRDDILAAVWGYDARIDTHTLETHIYQLRRKLGGDKGGSEIIVNDNGLYRLGV